MTFSESFYKTTPNEPAADGSEFEIMSPAPEWETSTPRP